MNLDTIYPIQSISNTLSSLIDSIDFWANNIDVLSVVHAYMWRTCLSIVTFIHMFSILWPLAMFVTFQLLVKKTEYPRWIEFDASRNTHLLNILWNERRILSKKVTFSCCCLLFALFPVSTFSRMCANKGVCFVYFCGNI